MREHVLGEIRRIAKETGRPPGAKLFERETGIAPHQWLGKIWARWSDALTEAGYAPNEFTQRLDPAHILAKVIEGCRHYGKIPTKPEFDLYRAKDPSLPSYKGLTVQFGGRSGLLAALRAHIAGSEGYEDVLALLPSEPHLDTTSHSPSARTIEGFVYLIRSGDFYKIGRSDDIERRVKEIRLALPDKATLIHSIRTDDPAGIESYWHRRFQDKRANGEWFRLVSLDVAAFKKRKYQ